MIVETRNTARWNRLVTTNRLVVVSRLHDHWSDMAQLNNMVCWYFLGFQWSWGRKARLVGIVSWRRIDWWWFRVSTIDNRRDIWQTVFWRSEKNALLAISWHPVIVEAQVTARWNCLVETN